MATYPIKMLRDEDRQAFVPFTNAAAVVDKDNNSLQELMDNGKYKIQNNVTTASAGKGVLDAYQGKVLNDKFNNYVPLSQKGVANGVASLDSEGKVPSAQLPSYVDDVIESYIVSGSTALSSGWLSKTEGGAALTPEKGKIYLVMTSGSHQNKQYRWGGSTYVLCNPSDVNSVNGMTGVVTLKKLTIQKNGTQVGDTFNGTTDEVINITVPTNNNQLTNGAGYITSAGSITGNAATATKATQDGSGNVIVDTYVKKSGDILTGPLQYKTTNYTSTPITIKDDGTTYGHTLIVGAGGATIISAGESGPALSTELGTTSAETLYMIADGNLYLYSNANTIGDKKGAILTTGGHFHPLTNNAQTLGSTSNKWSNVYATTFNGDLAGTATNASKTTGTLTIQKNGTTINTFNGSADKTINISVPTTTANVTMDSTQALTSGGAYSKLIRRLKTNMVELGFTAHSNVDVYDFFKVVHSKMGAGIYVLEIAWSDANSAFITDGTTIVNINGGHMLCSISSNPTNGTWVTCAAHYVSNAAFSNTSAIISGTIDGNAGVMSIKKVSLMAKSSDIPTKVSQLTNDSNYVKTTNYASSTAAGVVKLGTGLAIADGVLSVTGAATADSVEWSVVKNRPTAVSYWTNDAGYIKASNTMKGATATTAGSAGTVPAPAAGKEAQFLRGDGTWAQPSYATSAGSATKATQDGSGNTITSTYLKLAGGTMSGPITSSQTSSTWINSVNGKSAINLTGTGYTGWISGTSKTGKLVISSYQGNDDKLYFGYMSNEAITAGTNALTRQMTWDGATGTLTATTFSGKLGYTLTLTKNGSNSTYNGSAATTVTIPTIHTGTGVPASSLGQNGDIYIVTG